MLPSYERVTSEKLLSLYLSKILKCGLVRQQQDFVVVSKQNIHAQFWKSHTLVKQRIRKGSTGVGHPSDSGVERSTRNEAFFFLPFFIVNSSFCILDALTKLTHTSDVSYCNHQSLPVQRNSQLAAVKIHAKRAPIQIYVSQ